LVRKVHIGKKWLKIKTIYNKEMKTTRRVVEGTRKENRKDRILLSTGEKEKEEQETGRGEGGWEKKIQRQDGKCRGEETDGMDRTKWMGGIEREETGGRRGKWTYIDSRGKQ
jgi:hypothetical protein